MGLQTVPTPKIQMKTKSGVEVLIQPFTEIKFIGKNGELMVDNRSLAVYNCKSCGHMVLGVYGPKHPVGKACPTCFGSFIRNDAATDMLERKKKDE